MITTVIVIMIAIDPFSLSSLHDAAEIPRHHDCTLICKSLTEPRTRTEKMAKPSLVFRRGVARSVIVDGNDNSREDQTTGLLMECKTMENNMRRKFQAILTAHEDERKKLSLLLDDEVAQTLLGIHVRLLALKKEASEDSAAFSNEIVNTQRLIVRSAETIKRIARMIVMQHEI